MNVRAWRLVAIGAALLVLAGCSCGKKDCVPGEAGCACLEGSQCTGDAVCGADNLCVAPVVVEIRVGNPAARGCELLLTGQGAELAKVSFTNGVTGSFVHEAPRAAVTFVAKGDEAIPNGGVRLALSSGTAEGLLMSKVKCVDKAGSRLDDAPLTLQ